MLQYQPLPLLLVVVLLLEWPSQLLGTQLAWRTDMRSFNVGSHRLWLSWPWRCCSCCDRCNCRTCCTRHYISVIGVLTRRCVAFPWLQLTLLAMLLVLVLVTMVMWLLMLLIYGGRYSRRGQCRLLLREWQHSEDGFEELRALCLPARVLLLLLLLLLLLVLLALLSPPTQRDPPLPLVRYEQMLMIRAHLHPRTFRSAHYDRPMISVESSSTSTRSCSSTSTSSRSSTD
jgi:hypothetical protein